MSKVNIRASVHGKSCVGCKRLDAFLTNAEAKLLIEELNNIMLENEKENK